MEIILKPILSMDPYFNFIFFLEVTTVISAALFLWKERRLTKSIPEIISQLIKIIF